MTDERWRECKHHHHGCACHEHEWEERVATLKRERDKACANYQFMVDRAANEKLDGYRELGQRCADLEAELDRLRGDRAGWAARSQEQFDRIGVALDSVRGKRPSGEPTRDDATEVESLVYEVKRLTKMNDVCAEVHVHNVMLKEKVDVLKVEVDQLKSETYCAYCGERFSLEMPQETDLIGAHIGTCSQHPMRVVEAEVERLEAELDRVKSNYEYLKGDWNKACELTQEHCPCPLGTSHITDGIPRLAARAKRLEAERDALRDEVELWKAHPVLQFVISEPGPGPEAGRFIEVEDGTGHSICVGRWAQMEDGNWSLTVPYPTGEEEHLKAEVDRLKSMSTAEMMGENQSVHDHVVEWEGRCLRAEAEVERLKAEHAKWENEMLKELFVWADDWLSDEAKDQGAHAVLQRVRAALAGTTGGNFPKDEETS